METMPLGLREQEDQVDKSEGQYCDIEPPEVAPVGVVRDRSGNDWANLFESDRPFLNKIEVLTMSDPKYVVK